MFEVWSCGFKNPPCAKASRAGKGDARACGVWQGDDAFKTDSIYYLKSNI